MSIGVNLLASLVKQAAACLKAEEFDVEISEIHHKHKKDAPSGTALLLGEAAAEGRAMEFKKLLHEHKETPRKTGNIGFASLRGGSVIGQHNVYFLGNSEQILLSHNAENRKIFVEGALQAVRWIQNKKAGLYSMQDVLGFTKEQAISTNKVEDEQ